MLHSAATSNSHMRYVSFMAEMFLDEAGYRAISVDKVEWILNVADEELRQWRADGFDHTLFPRGQIPFKLVQQREDGSPVQDITCKYYALAHRAKHVVGPPVALAVVKLESGQFFEAVAHGSVIIP